VVEDRSLPEGANDLPPDLQLPTPAAPFQRLVAGMVDASVSAAVGALVAGAVHMALHVQEAASVAGVVAATAAWIARDCVLDEGNRSLGKKLQDIEVAYWDGTLPTRSDCLKRNIYWAAFPFVHFHPLCNQVRRRSATLVLRLCVLCVLCVHVCVCVGREGKGCGAWVPSATLPTCG
jgi:hypothetical protein